MVVDLPLLVNRQREEGPRNSDHLPVQRCYVWRQAGKDKEADVLARMAQIRRKLGRSGLHSPVAQHGQFFKTCPGGQRATQPWRSPTEHSVRVRHARMPKRMEGSKRMRPCPVVSRRAGAVDVLSKGVQQHNQSG
mmetsp:Transcript_7026/g.11369  ORF Transcript_7026/g.11369 Transcript_7026/m.11369 type:complete len:135 (+) Transcript_7026:338-742(+)